MSEPISIEFLTGALDQNKPIRVNIEGYPIAVLFRVNDVIQNATSRFVHVMVLDLLSATADEVHDYIERLVK